MDAVQDHPVDLADADWSRRVLDALPGIAAYWDRDLRCRFSNRAHARLFGLDAERTNGVRLPDLLGAAAFDEVRPHVEAVLRGEPRVFSRTIANDPVVPGHTIELSYLPDVVDGELRGFISFVVDTTARVQAERELARSERELREAQRIAGVGSWEWDVASGVVGWSDEMYRIFGRDPALGPPSLEQLAAYHLPETYTKLRRDVGGALAHGTSYESHRRVHRADGSVVWIESTSEPIVDASGERTGLRGVVKDVTATQLAARALLASEHDLLESQRIARVGGWWWDARSGEVVWSASLRALHGLPADAHAPTLPEQEAIYTPESWARLSEAVRVALQTGKTYEVDLDLVRPLGTANVLAMRAFGEPWRDDEGVIAGLRGVTMDVTEMRAATEARRVLEAQVHELAKMETVGRLAGGIAHDFNNLLTVIAGDLDYAIDVAEGAPDDLRAALREAREATAQSAELTRRLLAFARQQAIAPADLDLVVEIPLLLGVLRRLVGPRIRIVDEPTVSRAPARIDAVQLQQLLMNLIVNARDAIRDDGAIVVRTSRVVLDEHACAKLPGTFPGAYVELTVSDTGAGMPPEVAARAFEPFFTTKKPGHGTGLGLSIVYGVVHQHGGHVSVESELGRGTRFRILLPWREDQAAPASTRA